MTLVRLIGEDDCHIRKSATGHLGFLKLVEMCGFVREREWREN